MLTKSQESKMIGIIEKAFLQQVESAGGKGYRYYHSLRTYQNAKKFIKMKEIYKNRIDSDALLVAALFHDIGRKKNRRKVANPSMPGHESDSGNMLKKLLKDIVPVNTIDKAAKIINPNETSKEIKLEKELLYYADELDSIGMLKIWRMFTYEAYNKGTIENKIFYWNTDNSKRFNSNWIDTFKIPRIRKIAQRRAKIQQEAMEELAKENSGLDIK